MKRAIAFVSAAAVFVSLSHNAIAQPFAVYEVSFQFDGGQSSLYQFDYGGSLVTQGSISQTLRATSMTTSGGKLYIGALAGPIDEYNQSGAFVAHFANVAAQAGNSASIPRLESDSAGNVYAAYGGQGFPSTSFRLDSNGLVSQTFSHPNLTRPRGIDAAANHDVYIIDSSSHELFRFASTGTYIADYELPQLYDPSDLAIDETRNDLYIGDEFGKAVLKYDISTGAPVFVNSFSLPGNVIDVFVEPSTGQVYGIFSEGAFGPFEGFRLPLTGSTLTLFPTNAATFELFTGIVAIPVPEPTTASLLLLGMLGFTGRRRRPTSHNRA